MSLIRAAACGLAAGAAGTVAMDLVWYARHKRGGGTTPFLKWEFANAPTKWDDASAPAKVFKLLYETTIHRPLPEGQIQLASNVMHWGYGVQWGVVVALALESSRQLKLWHAPVLGALVWLSSYVSLPIAGFYKPIWSYDLETLWNDLSAHLVYGAGTVAGFWLACRS